ncbi:RNA polymerase sigma factor [Patiriisocius marinus]|uniref:Sigma-70 family RNA polymerase sigma factor n=1 Tax=Patiriisocius marinus TaxID=1397112 RepID=A0A5J4ILY1_9FLAO|nr:sigma-70 family RNA polymerase sigma factor [Patiriisocius marinus]GER58109.1 hypothetical protein ULMA_02170 [Patiriisocius marinus]
MKPNISLYKNKQEFRLSFTRTFPELVKSKKEGNQEFFNQQVLKITPDIRKYINGQFNTAIKKGHFPKNKYKADDIIDQLFIEIYNHIEEVNHEDEFYVWLLKKTNELLDDVFVNEEFDELFFNNIDDYSKPEWDELQEKYSTDGGGDLLMIEDLDDMSYNHNDYSLNHVFVEEKENDLVKKIDKNLKDEEVQKHIEMVLHNLPTSMRNIFELFTKQHLEIEEIAQIKNITIDKAKQLLKDAKKALQLSLLNRYPKEDY